MKYLFTLLVISCGYLNAQENILPSYFNQSKNLTNELNKIVVELGLNKEFDVGEDGIEQISLAVVNMTNNKSEFAGYNHNNFIYPASVYKMYVAAEVLNQISKGIYSLGTIIEVKSPNDVDKSREISIDPRPLIKDGDSVTVNYLLDLMITRSDNSAANCLIDLADRNNINQLIKQFNWEGSEVTRKFLSRKLEDPGYANIKSTETNALHAADFLYLVYNEKLINPWVSMQLKTLLGRQLDNSKLATGLPKNAMFYNKTGWYSYWTHDVGIVDDGNNKYIIACFLPISKDKAIPKLKQLGKKIHNLITTINSPK